MAVVSPKVLIAFAAMGVLGVFISLYSLSGQQEISQRIPLVRDFTLSQISQLSSSLQEHTNRLFASSAASSSLFSAYFSRIDEATRQALVEHANGLALKVVPQLTHGAVFSPLPLAFSLSVLHQGSTGVAQRELSTLLNGQYSLEELHTLADLFANNASRVLHMTSALALNKHLVKFVNQSFLHNTAAPLLRVYYADFDKKDGVSRAIDDLFRANTDQHVENIGKRVIKSKQSMTLINTLYFRSQWAVPFDAAHTPAVLAPHMNFTQENGNRRLIKALCATTPSLPYFENDEVQLFEISFKDEDFAMGFFVPVFTPTPQRKRPPSLLGKNMPQLFSYIEQLRPYEDVKESTQSARVCIPKMRSEKMHRFAPQLLQRLGVKDTFDASKNKQAFSKIAKMGATLSEVVQETFLYIDEFGANSLREWQGSRLLRRQTSASPYVSSSVPEDTPLVEAKHTFLYYVRHKPTKMLLFVGDFDG